MQALLGRPELGNGLIDLDLLLFEMGDLLNHLFGGELEIASAIFVAVTSSLTAVPNA